MRVVQVHSERYTNTSTVVGVHLGAHDLLALVNWIFKLLRIIMMVDGLIGLKATVEIVTLEDA